MRRRVPLASRPIRCYSVAPGAGGTMSDEPIAREAYEQVADAFAAQAETKPHNAFYDRPALLSLLPPVRGKAVLDAGCGPGVYAEALLERGAAVLGLDVSPRMVELARARLGQRASIRLADLGRPLDLPEASFDVVISGLALDHVRDWDRLFAELFRVLRDPGWLVFSVAHPFDEY